MTMSVSSDATRKKPWMKSSSSPTPRHSCTASQVVTSSAPMLVA